MVGLVVMTGGLALVGLVASNSAHAAEDPVPGDAVCASASAESPIDCDPTEGVASPGGSPATGVNPAPTDESTADEPVSVTDVVVTGVVATDVVVAVGDPAPVEPAPVEPVPVEPAPAEPAPQPDPVPPVDLAVPGTAAATDDVLGPSEVGTQLDPVVLPQVVPASGPASVPLAPPCSGEQVAAAVHGIDGGAPTVLSYDAHGNLRVAYADGTPVHGEESDGAGASRRGPVPGPEPWGGSLPAAPTAPGPVVSAAHAPTSGNDHFTSQAVLLDELVITGGIATVEEGVLFTPRERANGTDDHPG